jgi:membrane fusion protein (multidrug efflux system)
VARRIQDSGQKMYKDAPASEVDWDKASSPRLGGSASPKRDIISLRASPSEAPPADERPVEAPEADRPAKPGETERPPQPFEKEGEPGKGAASQEEKPAANDEKAPEKPRKNFLRRHPLMAGAGLIALLVAGATAYVYWDHTSHFESTDDAFIAARQFAIAPKIAGYVTAVPVTDNQHVNKGDVIAKIDQRDYLTALAQAQAQVAGAEAGIHNVDAQISAQDAQISAAQAQVAQAQANQDLAKVTWGRDQPLVKQGWATAQQGTTDVQNLKAQQATVDSAQATLKVEQRQIDTLRAQRSSQEATLAQAKAQLDQANLNLSYTTVTADQPGRVVNLSGAVGQYAQPGTNLAMLVPDEIWVVANYKETQLDRMRPAQPVDLEIDAYSERHFHGHVDSVQPGSGPAFSLLPPENATGNYVKIV